MSARSRHHTLMLIACFAAVYVLWGSTYVGMKVAVQRIPPMLLGGGRFLFAGLCLMTIVAMFGGLQRRWLGEWRYWRTASITSGGEFGSLAPKWNCIGHCTALPDWPSAAMCAGSAVP